jgi:hypothetical protein
MNERDRIALRHHQEEVEAEERAEKERTERPFREAEKKLQKTTRQLAAVYRERLLGTVPDPERIEICPSVATVKMTEKQAGEFNRAEFREYRELHPEVFVTPELLKQLGDYFAANGLKIITAAMVGRLVAR